ncbi:hypothetical protein AKJ65_06580 [candidate division MSBL1 archaeon SCGC-AAA259E19]|uniref:CBS domain-containing protein n=1 Tax=candidate division MSBL1 archaeon SCGC-AAA259E19 TaxID=1698264 RepID=A0A133UG51_9EURY|nr:hypothetical protein AKJ65_06580 [candidate division MSBL1 archaeon SCGC-AAA259E19]
MQNAEEVMVEDVSTFHPEDDLSKVCNVFAEQGIRGAPVVNDDGKVVGVITEHDINKLGRKHPELATSIKSHLVLALGLFREEPYSEEVADSLRELREKKVADAMSTDVVTVPPDKGLDELAKMMQKHEINRIPIVDEEGKLLGLVAFIWGHA